MSNYPDVWFFDENRRVYRDNGGGPVWKEHWRKLDIIGETRVSWLSRCRKKIPKKGGRGICFSRKEINEQAFIKENVYRIARMLTECTDYGTIKAVAELVGYESESNKD